MALTLVGMRGGGDAIWTASLWSGHDGMQHFRVAASPLTARPITDNPVRYGRILYPLAGHVVGRAAGALLPEQVRVPHFDEPQDGHLLGVAWGLLAITICFGFLTVSEAARALGWRGGVLVALCPLLLLAELHCLALPIIAWGTFRFLRRWDEGARVPELVVTAAALCLTHPAAIVLPVAYAIEPWFARRGRRAAAMGAALAALAVAPALAWHLVLWSRPGFDFTAGSTEYGAAAFTVVPFSGLFAGVIANVIVLREELGQGDILAAGARTLRHGTLIAGVLLLVAHPWLAGKRLEPTERRRHLAYWIPVAFLLAFADLQVTADLDNLGRLVYASPLCFAAWLAICDRPGARRWRAVLLAIGIAAFLAVDVNYLASFLNKVAAGGAHVAQGREWWFR